ncbi:phage tail tape measure protein [Paenibacillus elgii]|uniref:phage tail tape measure protein n=1 Tax=Paenibacillus elgii TaxID=189691 RepID=UPI00203F863F|nr:phage tail tape measure protein [Paenibacillus elgii]MCM3272635.1 phage tail tape measure protein [Paenibacillus elgii]
MSSILDLAISISLADHISSGIKGIIGNFKLMEKASDDAKKKMESFKTMGWVGGTVGIAGALGFNAVTDAVIGATKAAADFEDVMTNVKMAAFGKDLLDKNKAGEIKQTLDDLTLGFEKLGIATKFSDKAAAETSLGMLRGGIDKEFILGTKDAKGKYNYSGLTAAMYSAQLGDIDPQSSGDFIAKQKAAFNMNGDRTLEAVNFYAKTAAASTMDMKSLIPGMLTASGVAGTLGMTPEDTALLVAATGTYTKDGGSAGTFTKDFLDRLIPHTKKQKEAMAELGWLKGDGTSIFFNESGKIKGSDFLFQTLQETSKKFRPDQFQNMMSKVFLEQGKNTALALANQSQVYSDIKGNVNNQLDMYQQVDMQMQNTKSIAESFAETWSVVKRVFGDPFLEPVKAGLSAVKDILEGVIPWAKEHPQVIKIVTAVALGATAFLAIGGAITVGVAAFGALSTALATASIGLGTIALISGGVVAAIGAIGGAAYLIYKNWDSISPYVSSVWGSVKSATLSVWDSIKPHITGAASEIKSSVLGGFGSIASFFNEIWPQVKSIVSDVWPYISAIVSIHIKFIWFEVKTTAMAIWYTLKFVWTIVKEEAIVAWTLIKDYIKLTVDFISGIVKVGVKLLQGDWAGAGEAMKETTSKLWSNIKQFFSDGLDGVKRVFGTAVDAAKQWGKDMFGGVTGSISSLWGSITSSWSGIPGYSSGIWGKVKSGIVSVWDSIGPSVSGPVQEIWNTLKSAWSQISAFTKEVWPDIKFIVGGVLNSWWQSAKSNLTTIWNFIKFVWPGIRDVVLYNLKNIWIGIEVAGKVIWSTMKLTWSTVSEVVQVAWTNIKNIITFWWDYITGMIKIGLKVLRGDWSGAWEAMKELGSKLWSDIKRLFSDGWDGIMKLASTWKEAAKQWGLDIVDGLVKGIKDSWENVKTTMGQLWDEYVKDPFTKKAGINSPSRVMMEKGNNITQGVAIGIVDQVGLVKSASTSLFDAVQVQGPGRGAASNISVSKPSPAGGGGVIIQGPLVGEVHQQPGESADDFVERLYTMVRRRLDAESQRANLTIGSRGLARGY